MPVYILTDPKTRDVRSAGASIIHAHRGLADKAAPVEVWAVDSVGGEWKRLNGACVDCGARFTAGPDDAVRHCAPCAGRYDLVEVGGGGHEVGFVVFHEGQDGAPRGPKGTVYRDHSRTLGAYRAVPNGGYGGTRVDSFQLAMVMLGAPASIAEPKHSWAAR